MQRKRVFGRREFLRSSALIAGGLLAARCAPAATPTSAPTAAPTSVPPTAAPAATEAPKVGGTVNFLSWEGYDLPNAMQAFNAQFGVTVNSTYIGSNEEVMTKFQAGGPGRYDFGNVAVRFIESMIQQDMVLPLDLDRLPNWQKFYTQFAPQSPLLEMMRKGSDIYGIPTYFGVNIICYNADLVDKPAQWDVLIDPAYKGKVGMMDQASATVFMIAALLGHGTDARQYTPEILAEVAEWGKQWKANCKTLVKSYGEMIDLLIRGDIWLAAEGWEYVTVQGQKQGANLRHALPEGPGKAWSDAYFIFNGANNLDTVYAWLNAAISPEVMATAAQDLGSLVTSADAAELMPAEFADIMGVADLEGILERVTFSRFPDENSSVTTDDLLATYEEIKAA
jgi:spermidine/putrescine-binding protein